LCKWSFRNKAAVRPLKATSVELDRGASVEAAFAAICHGCIAQIQANEAGLLLGRNPEFLHQFRVGLRRLRSAFRTYRPVLASESYAAITAEMSWLASALSAARDWDVFLEETIVPLGRSESSMPGLAAFRRRCMAQQRQHALGAREAVSSPRYSSLKRRLDRFITTPLDADNATARRLLALPLADFARLRLIRREKAVRRFDKNLNTADATARHSLRIAAKKLRYAVEFFQSIFECKAVRGYTAALADMQDSLGKLNDCATARRLLECVPIGRDTGLDALTRGLVLGWIDAQEQQGLVTLEIDRRRWRSIAHFWVNPAD